MPEKANTSFTEFEAHCCFAGQTYTVDIDVEKDILVMHKIFNKTDTVIVLD